MEIRKENVDVVIVGGGPAGLAAAVRLYEKGVRDILIIERERHLGGILRQCIHDGFGLTRFRTTLSGLEYARRFIDQVKELNFSIGLFPISSMLAASQGMIDVLTALADQGSTLGVRDKMTDPPTRIHRMMGQFSLVEKYTPYYDQK